MRREWTPARAEEWTWEDAAACVFAVLGYLGITVGVALSLLARPLGYAILCGTVVVVVLMHLVIDPKLRAVSAGYEARQAQYLEHLERVVRWEERS